MTGPIGGHSLSAMPNLADLLTDSAAAHADRPAIKLDDHVLTYVEAAVADELARIRSDLGEAA